MSATVLAVSLSGRHGFSKAGAFSIRILEGLGVEGDAHAGVEVKHRFQARFNPRAPNLRQVHLIQAELFDDLHGEGFDIAPGAIGENITTRGVDLLALPRGTRLRLGAAAEVELTGLRNPCVLLDRYRAGLKQAMIQQGPQGQPVFRAGVMAVARPRARCGQGTL
jgi:MOSC domain-containing protein YiiM